MNGIDVAVAIVSYRSAELTIDCLRSIDAKRSTAGICIRAIVVDNASGDAPAIAEAIETNAWSSWVTLVRAPRNGGFAYGNNLAFQRALAHGRPDYFHLLNPDTVVRKGAIGALVHFLEEHPAVGIVGSSFENLDGSEWPTAFRFPSILSEIENGLQFGLATRILRRWVVPVVMSPVPQPIDWVAGASMMIRSTGSIQSVVSTKSTSSISKRRTFASVPRRRASRLGTYQRVALCISRGKAPKSRSVM